MAVASGVTDAADHVNYHLLDQRSGACLNPWDDPRRDHLSFVLSRCVLRGELHGNDYWLW